MNRKVPTEVLRREYVFDSGTPPISISDLASRHGLARSGVAMKATEAEPSWYRQREEFRKQIGEKVIANLADNWAEVQTHRFEMMVAAMSKTLEKYMERLENGEIKPTTRDAVAVVGALRVLTGDQQAQEVREATLIDPQSINLPADKLLEMIPTLKALLGGRSGEVVEGDFVESGAAESGPAGVYAPTGTEGTG